MDDKEEEGPWFTDAPKDLMCALCLNKIEVEPNGWTWGHNPDPLCADDPEARVCGGCNARLVLPARLQRMSLDKKGVMH